MISEQSKYAEVSTFSTPRVACPLCRGDDVEYEFVLDRLAFSQCQGCGLLFTSSGKRLGAPKPFSGELAGEPLRALLALVPGYAGAPANRTCAIAPTDIADIGGVPVRTRDSFADGERFDAIVVVGMLESQADPVSFLRDLGTFLEPRGTLLLLSPSTASPMARRMRATWPALRAGSRYYFSTDNLQLLATRCGYGDFLTFVDGRDVRSRASEPVLAWFHSNTAIICRPVERTSAPLLSVVFPVYNEAATVDESLRRVLDKEIAGIDIEVVIVESNSTDGSREIVQRHSAHPRVRIVYEDRPRGKGYAVRTGLAHVRGDVVLFQDADLEYDVRDYDELVTPLFELRKNFVLGSRHNARGEAWKIRHFADQPGVSFVANLAHVVLLRMFNTIYKQELRDPFTMYKVFRRDCLFGLSFECNRFDFDFEINIKLLRKGYRALEMPVNYLSRSFGEGKKVSFFGDPPTWVRAMLKLKRARLYALTRDLERRTVG